MGIDDKGHAFRTLMFNGSGMGGGNGADGAESVCYPTSSCNVPIELTEETSSVLTLEKELIPDSGGAGEFRGGSGVRVTVRPADDTASPLTFFAALHHQDFPPFGLNGGKDGTPTHARLNGRLLTSVEARDQLTARVVTDLTTTITVETAGGGGFGDPRRRDPHSVLRDVRNGLVTVQAARDVYGLDIDPTTLTAVPTSEP
jgi:N-methylhydantoinase B/oxoprolinase/acetone carboxylase alpha subunit